jgi:alkylhydroperoxidase family enzyme
MTSIAPTMARRPRVAALFAELAPACLEPGSLDRPLKQLVAYVASATTGCRYRQAHTAHDTSTLFDHPERVTDEHFDGLRRRYGDEQIAEIVGVIALFGRLNRWNDTMATTLESSPRSWARQNLSPDAWNPGRHSPEDTRPTERRTAP